MLALHGVIKESPFALYEYLNRFRGTLSSTRAKDLTFQYLGWGITPDEDALVTFIPSYAILVRYLNTLYEYEPVVFLFENPVLLAQIEVPLLDGENRGDFKWVTHGLSFDDFVYTLRSSLNGEKEAPQREKLLSDISIVPKLFSNVEGSLTQMLMNVTQSCSSPSKRKNITQVFAAWLVQNGTVASLIKDLENIRIMPQVLEKLETWTTSEKGVEARQICKKLGEHKLETGKKINYQQITKGTSVAPFDIRYLVHQIKNLSEMEEINENVQQIHKRRAALFRRISTLEEIEDED